MSRPGSGHNGGPPLDPPVRHERGQCKNCIHWHAPPENEQRAYEMFRLGLSRKRVKRPSGTCDRVLLDGRSSTAFSATTAEFGCLNFEPKPRPPRPVGAASSRSGGTAGSPGRDRRRRRLRVIFRKRSISKAARPRKPKEHEAQPWRSAGWCPGSHTADRGREGMRIS